jgi:hypothetical protein
MVDNKNTLPTGRIPIFTVKIERKSTRFSPGFTWGYSNSTPSGLGHFRFMPNYPKFIGIFAVKSTAQPRRG